MRLLQIDYDGPRLALHILAGRLDRAQRQVVGVWDARSPSGKGWHRVVAVLPPPQSALETVCLELVCGSDPYRGAYAVQRALAVDRHQVAPFWARRFDVLYV